MGDFFIYIIYLGTFILTLISDIVKVQNKYRKVVICMPLKLTQEEFEEKVKQVHNGNIIVLSKYINSKSKVHFKDIRCGHDWWSAAGTCYQVGCGCPTCGAKHSIRFKSTSQAKKELDDCTNGEYTMLSPYKGTHEDLVLLHNKCGYHWKTSLNSVVSGGQRCPNCGHRRKLTTEDFKQQVLDTIGTGYTVLSEYKNNHTKIKIRHEVCGTEYEVRPLSITSHHTRCPKCFGKSKYTQEEVQQIITNNLGPEFKLVSQYHNVKKPITIEHTIKNHQFDTTLDVIIQDNISCPICNESHMESITRQYLIAHNITFESQKRFPGCRYKRELPFDFYLPGDNTLIELDGGQHFKEVPYFNQHEDLTTRTRRDTIKDKYCTDKGINLIRIGYSELANLTKDLDKYLSNVQGSIRVGTEY